MVTDKQWEGGHIKENGELFIDLGLMETEDIHGV